LEGVASVTHPVQYRYAGETMEANKNQMISLLVESPKTEVIDQINKRLIDLKVQLELAKTQARSTSNPVMGSLNFEIHDLQKRLHALTLQIERIKMNQKTEPSFPHRPCA
jgi:hypothetical protein